MFYHTYDNIEDIEPEFVASLEALLKDRTPSFDFIKSNEKEETNSTYYLFFGNKDNSPKAFIKSKIERPKQTILNKIIPFKDSKFLKWSGPKTYSDSFFIDLKYKTEFSIFFQNMAKEKAKELQLKEHRLISPIPISKESTPPKKFLNSLFKTKNSYEEYIKSLNIVTQKEITSIFKDHHTLELKQYNSLLDCFSYKEKSKDEYKSLKKNWPYNLLTNIEHSIMSLETNDQILAFTVLIKNDLKHSFFYTNNLLNLVDERILTQLALMLFYEENSSIYLHSLNKVEFTSEYEKLNFDSYIEKEYVLS